MQTPTPLNPGGHFPHLTFFRTFTITCLQSQECSFPRDFSLFYYDQWQRAFVRGVHNSLLLASKWTFQLHIWSILLSGILLWPCCAEYWGEKTKQKIKMQISRPWRKMLFTNCFKPTEPFTNHTPSHYRMWQWGLKMDKMEPCTTMPPASDKTSLPWVNNHLSRKRERSPFLRT